MKKNNFRDCLTTLTNLNLQLEVLDEMVVPGPRSYHPDSPLTTRKEDKDPNFLSTSCPIVGDFVLVDDL